MVAPIRNNGDTFEWDKNVEFKGYNGSTVLKRSGCTVHWTPDMMEEYMKCAEDPIYFAEKYIKIVHVDRGLIPIKLYDYQIDIIDKFNGNRNTVICTGRQQGKTTTATCILLHFVLFNQHKTIALLAHKEAGALEIMDRIQLAYAALPKWMQSGVVEWNKKSIELENGCKIIASATAGNAIRGKSCVTGDTIVRCKHTPSGNICDIQIKDINKDYLLWDGVAFRKFDGLNIQEKEVFHVVCHESSIKATSDHRLLTEQGDWITVGELIVGFKLKNVGQVLSVTPIGIDTVYDPINVENTNRYVSNGFISHNCNVVYIDEVAFVHDYDTFFSSVYPTISSGVSTKMLYTSTPNGLNHFYKIMKEAKEGRNGFAWLEVPWDKVPGRDETWKDNTLKALNFNYEQFEQEYNCSFQGSSGTLLSGSCLKTLSFNNPIYDQAGLKKYEDPIKGHTYMITVDVSRAKGQDYSAFQVIDISKMPYKQVATYRNNRISPINYAELLNSIGTHYNEAHILVENNDIGGQVADTLFYDLEYENILFTASGGTGKGKVLCGGGNGAEPSIRTTTATKSKGCSMLKLLMEQQQLIIQDFDTINELSRFSKKGKSYEAEEGNDDLVMCLVLFAWASSQQYFTMLTDIVTLHQLRDSGNEEDTMCFGFISDSADDADKPQYVIENGMAWQRDSWGIDDTLLPHNL